MVSFSLIVAITSQNSIWAWSARIAGIGRSGCTWTLVLISARHLVLPFCHLPGPGSWMNFYIHLTASKPTSLLVPRALTDPLSVNPVYVMIPAFITIDQVNYTGLAPDGGSAVCHIKPGRWEARVIENFNCYVCPGFQGKQLAIRMKNGAANKHNHQTEPEIITQEMSICWPVKVIHLYTVLGTQRPESMFFSRQHSFRLQW